MGFGKMLDSLIKKFHSTRDTAKSYKDLNEGKEINYTPRSDRYTYEDSSNTNYNKDWKPITEEEKKTLSPKGFFRVGERAKERAKLQKGIDSVVFDDQYKEKQESVDSTCLSNVRYNPDTEVLTVKFQGNNKSYDYPEVPLELVQALLKAPSKGEFFMANIHDQYSANPGHKPMNSRTQSAVKKAIKKSANDTKKKIKAMNGE